MSDFKLLRQVILNKYFMMAFVFIFSILPVSKVFAFDEQFYSGNDILFYNPDAQACGGVTAASSLEGNDNLEKILRYFVGKGLTLAQAAGIAGNIKQESGFDPTIIQGGAKAPDNYKPVSGKGFGIVQWTSGGRQDGLYRLAQSSNRKITDLQLQLDFVWKELSGSYKTSTLDKLKTTNSPVEAAVAFHNGYERSADSISTIISVRGKNAQKYFDQFKGTIGTNVVLTNALTPDQTSATCDQGGASNFVDDGFTIYNQEDARWGSKPFGSKTIASSGCGPTSMATIITALTQKSVTPDQTTAYANTKNLYIEGAGASHSIAPILAEHWGLNAKAIGKNIAAINKGLRDGGLVIIAGTGATPFTSVGHYITIRAVTEGGKWKIADSNGKVGQENSKKEWDPNSIVGNASASSAYLISK